MNFILFFSLLAIIVVLYLIYVRLTELVNLMSVLVSLIHPRSEEYDASKKNESAPETPAKPS